MLREAFEADTCRAEIPAAILRERLTHVTEPTYTPNMGHMMASALFAMLSSVSEDKAVSPANCLKDATIPMTVEEAVEERERTVYKGTDKDVEESLKEFRDFVALAEKQEAAHNKPCTVFASY